ncbi:MAG: MFS transporter [Zymomonas mobilis]|uniref:MFS transporter n=1 Tax=Zymomonas mobilis TaxID=542 RepID=UPI0039EBD08F
MMPDDQKNGQANSSDVEGMTRQNRNQAMGAISVSVAMAILDTAIVNTALPSIAKDLGVGHSDSVWIITAYQMSMVAAMLPFAAYGDLKGHRKVFLTGLGVFILASLACGISPSFLGLVAARFVQGIGAAAIMSANTALVRQIYPARILGRGLGLNALVMAFSFAAGPPMASIILSFTSWHWLFLINVPICILAFFLSWQKLPKEDKGKSQKFDVVPAVICASLFALWVHGLGQLAHGSMTSLPIIEEAVALILGIFLVRWQSSHERPLLAVDLFRISFFSLSAITAFLAFIVQGMIFVAMPFLLQGKLGFDVIMTGFLIAPWPLMGAFLAPIAGRLSDRYPAGILGGIGLAILGLGIGVISVLPPHTKPIIAVIMMALCGGGFGFFLSPNQRALMSSAPTTRSGAASGVLGISRILGQTTGATLVAFCLYLSSDHGAEIALRIGIFIAFAACMVSLSRLLKKPILRKNRS